MPNEKQLARLNALLSAFDSGAVQPDELVKAIDAVMAVIKSSTETIAKRVKENDDTTKSKFKELEIDVDKALTQLSSYSKKIDSDKASKTEMERMAANFKAEIQRAIDLIPELPDGYDDSELSERMENQRELIESLQSLVVAENLRNALEALPEGDKLAIEAIEGLRDELDRLKKNWGNGKGGGIGQGIVLDLIRESVANGTIPSGGTTTFTGLTDTPASYTSQGGKLVRVNTGETALEFIDPPSGTGDVVGPASAVDDRIATFDGVTGKLIQDGGSTIANVLARANHTGTQTASTISDFDTEVSNNTDVAANTSARHSAVTLAGTPDYITISGQVITRNQIDLATDVTGDLPFANLATLSAHQVLGRAGSGTGDVAGITMGNDTILGRSGSGNVDALSASQVRTILNVEDGANNYTSEMAQDAVGGILTDSTSIDLIYDDAGNTISAQREALTGAITASKNSNTTALGSFTKAQLDTAVSDGNVLYVGDVTTNATHTGEVTGSGALTVDKTAITNKTLVTAAVGDQILVADASDTDNLKRVTVQTIVDLASGGGNTIFNDEYKDVYPNNSVNPVPTGTVNGSNTVFYVSDGVYAAGTTEVERNGQEQTLGASADYTESNPATGEITFAVAPTTSDVFKIKYKNVVTNSSTVVTTDTERFIYSVAVSDETTDLTTGTAKITFRMPAAMTLTAVRASVTTAPTGSTLIVDINEGGTSVLGTKLSIDASEKTSTTAASAATITDSALADDAEITIDIDQVGSTVAGAGLKVTLIGTYA